MKLWKAVAAVAGLLIFAFVLLPVRYTTVCGYDRGGLHFPHECYKRYASLSDIPVHPAVSLFVVMCGFVAGLGWLLRRPSPQFITKVMEARGLGWSLARGLLFVAAGALLIIVFFGAPLWVLEMTDAPGPPWYQWAMIGFVFSLWTFLIFGPTSRGGPSRAHRYPSALLGPDREPPPDSRRY